MATRKNLTKIAPRLEPSGRDLVDVVNDDWRREMRDIDQSGVELTRRAVRLGSILQDRLAEQAERWNLTRGEVNVLTILRSVGSPYELRPTDLKARLLLSSGGVSNVLSRLEASALIERQPDGTDGRSSWVRLTEQGAELAYAFAQRWSEAQLDTYRGLSPELLRLASDALREVLLALGDDEPPARAVRDA
jgi:DNA-binding MarR family transcriptional regulator